MDPTELLKQLGIDLATDAPHLDPIDRAIDFTIYTRSHEGQGTAVKAWYEGAATPDEPEAELLLSGTASSTIKDLHGDTMLPTALIDMEKAANNNLTMYLNHQYSVPEDIAGSVVKASLATSEVDAESGVPIYDLIFEKIRVDRTNDRAVKSWRSMHGGTKLGMSIGAQIPEGGAVRNKKTGALLIAHVNLLETSIVAIPANPRSWMDAVAKAYKAAPKQFAGVTIESVEVSATDSAGTTTVATIEPVTTNSANNPETNVPVDTSAAADDPSTDTSAPSQEAPAKSQPENDGAVATPEVVAAANDVLAKTSDTEVTDEVSALLREAHNALATVTNQLIETDEARKVAEQRAEAAEAERDAMKTATEEVIVEVANLIEQVGKLPAGRVASFKALAQTASDQSIDWAAQGFAPEVVRLLQRPKE